MEKLVKNLFKILIILFLVVSCTENKKIKMVIFNENHKTILEEIILYKNLNIEIIDNGNYWTIKNINEEALLELAGIAHLKMDVIACNIENVNTENYVTRYVKITAGNGIEVVNGTENVNLDKELADMIEAQQLYEASITHLKKINKNIIFM